MLLFFAALSPAIVTAAGSKASCSSATFTINSAADATALSQCSSLIGDVEIGPDPTSINLSGPVSITGDLRLANVNLISLSSNSIATIAGTLAINNATILSTLAFSKLTTVGSLQMQTVPSLSKLGFESGITSAQSVYIEDTFLGSLSGLAFTQIVDLTLAQNRRLNAVDLPLANSTGILMFVENGQSLKLNLSDLTTVNELYISNITRMELPSLQRILGAGRLDANYFTTFSAPVLQFCGGDGLSVVNNPDLKSLLLPQLSSVTGSMLIANNSMLTAIDGLNVLVSISNDIDFIGNFYDVALPNVVNVGGNLFVSSPYNITESCAALQRLAPVSQGGGGQVHGNFTCLSDDKNVSPDSQTSSTTSSLGTLTSTLISKSSSSTTFSNTSPISPNATPTSSTTPAPGSSSGSRARSEASKCGMYLATLILAILT